MKRPKRSAVSKSGSIFRTGSSPTDSKGIHLSYSDRAVGGVGSTSQSLRVLDGGGGAEGLGGRGSEWDNVGYVHQLHLGTPMFTNWVVR